MFRSSLLIAAAAAFLLLPVVTLFAGIALARNRDATKEVCLDLYDPDGSTHPGVVLRAAQRLPLGATSLYGMFPGRVHVVPAGNESSVPYRNRFYSHLYRASVDHVGDAVGFQNVPGDRVFPLVDEDLVNGTVSGALAWIGRDGAPHLVPVLFLYMTSMRRFDFLCPEATLDVPPNATVWTLLSSMSHGVRHHSDSLAATFLHSTTTLVGGGRARLSLRGEMAYVRYANSMPHEWRAQPSNETWKLWKAWRHRNAAVVPLQGGGPVGIVRLEDMTLHPNGDLEATAVVLSSTWESTTGPVVLHVDDQQGSGASRFAADMGALGTKVATQVAKKFAWCIPQHR